MFRGFLPRPDNHLPHPYPQEPLRPPEEEPLRWMFPGFLPRPDRHPRLEPLPMVALGAGTQTFPEPRPRHEIHPHNDIVSRLGWTDPPRFAPAQWHRFAQNRRTRPWQEIALAVAITVAAFLWLAHCSDSPMTEFERSRDLLSARDCVALARCSLIGPPSSTFNTHQGAVWIEILTAVEFLRGSPAAVLKTVNVLLAMGVGTVFLVTWRWLRPAFALPSVLFVLAALDRIHTAGQFVNPSTEFFPAALACSALLLFALTGRIAMLIWAAVCVAHAANTHMGALCLFPTLVALAAIAGPMDLGLAVGVFLAASWITSSEALGYNLRDSALNVRALVGGHLALAVAARFAASRFGRLGVTGRALGVAALMVGPFAAFMVYRLLPHVVHGGEPWLYAPPVLAPCAVGSAALLVLVLEWSMSRVRGLAFVVVNVVPVAVGVGSVAAGPGRLTPGSLTYESAYLIARHMSSRGWTYGRMARGLQVRDRYYLLLGLMPYARPDPPGGTVFDPRLQVRVWFRSPGMEGALPAGAEILHTGDTSRDVVLSEIDSWLDPWRAQVCIAPPDSHDEPTCHGVTVWPDLALRPFTYSNRLIDEVLAVPGQGGCRITQVIPLQPVAGTIHGFSSPDYRWVITQVSGVDVDEALPAKRVRLRSRDGTPGRIILEAVFGPGSAECGNNQFPSILESTPDDPPWTYEDMASLQQAQRGAPPTPGTPPTSSP